MHIQTHKRRKERLVDSKISLNLVLDTWELCLMKILNAILARWLFTFCVCLFLCVFVWCSICMYVQWVPFLTDSLYLNMQVIIFTICIWRWYLSIQCLEYYISYVLLTCTICKTHPCFSINLPITNQVNHVKSIFVCISLPLHPAHLNKISCLGYIDILHSSSSLLPST